MWWQKPRRCLVEHLPGDLVRVNQHNGPLDAKAPSAESQGGFFTETSDEAGVITRTRGRKRRFGLAGIANVLLTNVILQLLLASNWVGIAIATLISQAVNTIFGYAIYGKLVFRAQGLRHHKPILRYLILMAGMWFLNTLGIEIGEAIGLNKNIAAAALIPCLAVLSYATQKAWVFK